MLVSLVIVGHIWPETYSPPAVPVQWGKIQSCLNWSFSKDYKLYSTVIPYLLCVFYSLCSLSLQTLGMKSSKAASCYVTWYIFLFLLNWFIPSSWEFSVHHYYVEEIEACLGIMDKTESSDPSFLCVSPESWFIHDKITLYFHKHFFALSQCSPFLSLLANFKTLL